MMRLLILPLLVLTSCDCVTPKEEKEEEVKEKVSWEKPLEEHWTAIQFGGEGAAQWNDGVLHLDLGVELTGPS